MTVVRAFDTANPKAAEDESLRQYFASLTRDQIDDIAFHQYKDAERLRRELDDAQGVIR